MLLESVKHNFPYVNAPFQKQVSYLYNVLKIIQYQPDLRVNILQVSIDKLLLLDVNSPREEILQFEENTNSLLYDMEIEEEKEIVKSMKHPVANTLDVMMDIMFNFVKNECFVDGKLNRDKCVELYKDLLVIFEAVILPTHECHHVQFIIFYICSFDQSLGNDFLKFLWRNIVTPSVSPVIRQACVSYITSLLARAEYLSLG